MEKLSMEVERPRTETGSASLAAANSTEAVALPARQMAPNCSQSAHTGRPEGQKHRLAAPPSAQRDPTISTALRE